MKPKDWLAGLSCGMLALGLMTSTVQANEELAQMKREALICKQSGGVYKYGKCEYPEPQSGTSSGNGSSLLLPLAAGGLLCLMYPKDCRELFTGSGD